MTTVGRNGLWQQREGEWNKLCAHRNRPLCEAMNTTVEMKVDAWALRGTGT